MNILVVGPSWVGDMVMAQTLFACLKQQHPDCNIDVLAPDWSRPLLERMPEVRQALGFPLGHGVFDLATRRKIGKQLKGQYDQAILLPNSLKSALTPFFAGIPKHTGWKREMRYGLLNDLRILDKQRYPLMIERFMALAYPPATELPKPYPRPSLQIDHAERTVRCKRFRLKWLIAQCWPCVLVLSLVTPSVGPQDLSLKLPMRKFVKAGRCGFLAQKMIIRVVKKFVSF